MDPCDQAVNAALGVDEATGLLLVQVLHPLPTHGVYDPLEKCRQHTTDLTILCRRQFIYKTISQLKKGPGM